MKRRFSPAFLALCLILTLLPLSAMAEGTDGGGTATPQVAQIGDKQYETLTAAVTAAGTESQATIELLTSTSEDITIPEGANITLSIPENTTLTNNGGDTISNKGTLTITRAGTVDNVTNGKGSLVNYPSGTVSLNDNITLTRSKEARGNSWYVIKNLGTLTIENAVVNLNNGENSGGGSSLIASGWYNSNANNTSANDRKITHTGSDTADLTITGGTFKGGMNTIKNDDFGVLKITGGTFTNAAGPNVMNWHHTTISGGSFSDSSSTTGLLANGYIAGGADNGLFTITGGTFTSSNSGKGSLVGLNDGREDGGTLSIEGGSFTGALPGGNADLKFALEISGGTFSADPNAFAKEAHIGVKNAEGKFDVMSYDKVIDFAPTFDLSKSGGVKSTKTPDGFDLSGTVDPRTYTVTDKNLQTLFATILTGEKPATSRAALTQDTAKVMYIKDNKIFSFATMHFDNLVAGQSYIIQQKNPALNYAYGKDAFADNTKIKSYTCEELADGLSFIISGQTGDITFSIAPVPATTNLVSNEVTLPEKATVYTITNGVSFTSSAKPGETTVEPPVKVETDGDTVTAKTEVVADTITEAITSAGTGGTVTIEATTNDTGVNAVEVSLPKATVEALATSTEAKVKDVALKTPVGTITLSDSALKTIAANNNVSSNGATVTAKETTATTTVTGSVKAFEVKVTSSDNNGASSDVTISDLDTPITLAFDIGTGLKNPVLLHLDKGVLKNISSSNYDSSTGIITGTTTHLSTFAVVDAMTVEAGGIGCKVTLTGTANKFLTIQVTNDNANSIYTVKADDSGKAEIYVKSGTVLNVWQTDAAPTFESGQFKPKGTVATLVDNQTVTVTAP